MTPEHAALNGHAERPIRLADVPLDHRPVVPRQPTFWERFSFQECIRWAAFVWLCLYGLAALGDAFHITS